MKEFQFSAIFPIFRGPFLKRVAHSQHTPILVELKREFSKFSPPNQHRPLSDLFDFFYQILLSNYRCEYIYKNIITTELYLKEYHSLQNSLLINEFRSGRSRADIVIFNGTSTVYEIKSEYDSFDRLDNQLADYQKVFDRIVVVTTKNRSNLVIDRVDDTIGIMSLDARGELAEVRKAESNKSNTDPETVFDCMRQSEFCAAVKKKFGYTPNVPNSRIYRESRKLFCQIEPSQAHDLMVEHIQMRGRKKAFGDLVDRAPISLKHACLSFSVSQALAIKIKERLAEPSFV